MLPAIAVRMQTGCPTDCLLVMALIACQLHPAGAHACRVQELEVEPSNFVITPQSAHDTVVFDPIGQTMALHLNSSGGARVTANFPPQLYGQLEVLARVSVHPAVVTSIDVRADVLAVWTACKCLAEQSSITYQ